MASNSPTPTLHFKRGDDLNLELTVQDTNNATAIAAAATLAAADEAYAAALAAHPQVEQDIIDTAAAVTAAQASYDNSILVDISTWTITAKMTWCGQAVDTFTVVQTDAANGVFIVTHAKALTALWQLRKFEADINFVRPEGSISSETFFIDVERGATNG